MEKPKNTEKKDDWLSYGEKKEREFVETIAPKIGIDAKINPKKNQRPEAIDLIVDDVLADLKTQETPFFTSLRKSDIPPQWCVTFNVNDFERYKEKNERLDIIFWVRWIEELEGYGERVNTMEGVWKTKFDKIERKINNNDITKHNYNRREDDDRNARDSFLLDLREMNKLASLKGRCKCYF